MRVSAAILITLLASLYVLLAIQAEPVTATLGFVAAGILALALVVSFLRK
jgi:hypothetical protein